MNKIEEYFEDMQNSNLFAGIYCYFIDEYNEKIPEYNLTLKTFTSFEDESFSGLEFVEYSGVIPRFKRK